MGRTITANFDVSAMQRIYIVTLMMLPCLIVSSLFVFGSWLTNIRVLFFFSFLVFFYDSICWYSNVENVNGAGVCGSLGTRKKTNYTGCTALGVANWILPLLDFEFFFFFYSFSLSRKRRRPDGNHHPSSFFFVNWPVVRPLHAYRMMSLTLLYRNRKKWIFSFVAEASKVYYFYSPIRSGFVLRQGPFFCCCCCCLSISFLNR